MGIGVGGEVWIDVGLVCGLVVGALVGKEVDVCGVGNGMFLGEG